MSSSQNLDQATTTVTLPIKGTVRPIFKCTNCDRKFYGTPIHNKTFDEMHELLQQNMWFSVRQEKPDIPPALSHQCNADNGTIRRGIGNLVALEYTQYKDQSTKTL